MTDQSIPLVERRKLTRSGTATVLRVPQDWMKENKLKEGDEVIMIANGSLRFEKMTAENVMKLREQLTDNAQVSASAVHSEVTAAS